MGEEGFVQRGYRITGRVQGVYYRGWTRGVANELGLKGTVRNRRDGSVEVHVRGSAGAISEFEAEIWEGPAAAQVKDVEQLPSTGPMENGPFQILSTI